MTGTIKFIRILLLLVIQHGGDESVANDLLTVQTWKSNFHITYIVNICQVGKFKSDLAKVTKILYTGFRTILNSQKCKVALNAMYRIFFKRCKK